jgi:hypothetical protein
MCAVETLQALAVAAGKIDIMSSGHGSVTNNTKAARCPGRRAAHTPHC